MTLSISVTEGCKFGYKSITGSEKKKTYKILIEKGSAKHPRVKLYE